MPHIILIQPLFDNKELDRNIKTIYPLGLGYLAANIPESWDITVIDEQVDKVDYSMKADIVGISTTTLTINRGYEIAAGFKARGVPVLMGGVHASICPDEALQFCDTVLVGDAEFAMEQVLEDVLAGKLKKRYEGGQGPLKGIKFPRRDLFRDVYTFLPVSTSRGCPFDCSFCAINKFYNGKYRTREVEDVIAELKTLPASGKVIFFTDGNMYGYAKNDVARFKELCRRITEEKKKGTIHLKYFTGYASVNALDDIEALDLASEAGCIGLFVGFESINPDSLKDMNKTLNLKYGVDSYSRLVENAQKRKMIVVGEMIIGTDSDTPEVLEQTAAFLKNINFDILRLQIMQPLPGTRLFESLKNENRLLIKNFPEDWKKLSAEFLMGVQFIPKNLTANQIQTWVKYTGMDFYSPFKILKRSFKSLRLTRSPRLAMTTMIMNFKSRKTYANAKI